MELFDLQKLLANNECPHFMIFLGEDYAMANLYIDMVAKKTGLVKRSVDDIQTVFRECIGTELYPEDKLFVMRYPKELIAKEELWSKIKDKIGDNMLIIVFDKVDKKTKFYTQNKDIVVNFSPQDDKVFLSMVKSVTKMSPENIKELGKICGNNYGKFLSELDKIKNYSQAMKISEDDSMRKLISSGTIFTANKDVTFDFIGRVMKASKVMYEPYLILKLKGESNIKLVSILYSSMREQFICQTVSELSQNSTGLTPMKINICKGRFGIYKEPELRNALRLLQKMEQGVKMGIYDETSIIDYFLAEFLL